MKINLIIIANYSLHYHSVTSVHKYEQVRINEAYLFTYVAPFVEHTLCINTLIEQSLHHLEFS